MHKYKYTREPGTRCLPPVPCHTCPQRSRACSELELEGERRGSNPFAILPSCEECWRIFGILIESLIPTSPSPFAWTPRPSRDACHCPTGQPTAGWTGTSRCPPWCCCQGCWSPPSGCSRCPLRPGPPTPRPTGQLYREHQALRSKRVSVDLSSDPWELCSRDERQTKANEDARSGKCGDLSQSSWSLMISTSLGTTLIRLGTTSVHWLGSDPVFPPPAWYLGAGLTEGR